MGPEVGESKKMALEDGVTWKENIKYV